ncbi:MAG TPA: peptidase S9, partial [Bacteroidia bacterium]|nr:peptidase S9 [Bacteroidia bacterium]
MKNNRMLIAGLLCMLTTATFAQQTLTPESLWKLGRVSDPQLSPAGDKVLYNIRNFNLAANKGNTDIWIYDIKKNQASSIASDSSNETMPRWNTDGTRVFYLNDAGSSNQLWSMNVDGSDKKQVSKLDNDINLFGLSPTGNMIWIAQDVKLDNFFGR